MTVTCMRCCHRMVIASTMIMFWMNSAIAQTFYRNSHSHWASPNSRHTHQVEPNRRTWHSQPQYRQPQYRQPNYSAPAYRQPSYRGTVRRVTNYRPIHNASPGQYRIWTRANGTSATGYVAPDGSHWKLLELKGSYAIDSTGRRRQLSADINPNGHRYVWKIERPQQTIRNAWLCQDPKSKITSILYRQPPVSKLKFYSAVVTLDASKQITQLLWNETPTWADSVRLVRKSRIPKLPQRSYRRTNGTFVVATHKDLIAARQALEPTSRTLSPSQNTFYENNRSTHNQWPERMQQNQSQPTMTIPSSSISLPPIPR